jgi:hypothetical protein
MTAFAARTRPGPPENGRYQAGDTIPDSNGTVWYCSVGGFAGGDGMVAGGAKFVANPADVPVSTYLPGTVGAATVTAVEEGVGPVRVTTLTLAAFPITMTNANAYASGKIFTFPVGRIALIGSLATMAFAVAGTRTGTINDNSTVDWALGSVAASNVALTSTMVDMCAKEDEKAFAASGNGFSTSTSSALAAAAQFDGTTTPVPVYLNLGLSDADDIDGDTAITVNGTVILTWMHLGDY